VEVANALQLEGLLT